MALSVVNKRKGLITLTKSNPDKANLVIKKEEALKETLKTIISEPGKIRLNIDSPSFKPTCSKMMDPGEDLQVHKSSALTMSLNNKMIPLSTTWRK